MTKRISETYTVYRVLARIGIFKVRTRGRHLHEVSSKLHHKSDFVYIVVSTVPLTEADFIKEIKKRARKLYEILQTMRWVVF